MNLKQMEYFTAIVNEGSISAAAKALHISQPLSLIHISFILHRLICFKDYYT